MPRIVHELVHVHAPNKRCCTLLRAHEINRKQENKAAKNGPGKNLPKRNCRDGNRSMSGQCFNVSHVASWDCASRPIQASKEDLADGKKSRLQWRDRAGFAPASNFER